MKKKMIRAAIIGNAAVLLLAFVVLLFDGLRVAQNLMYDYNVKKNADHSPHEDIIVVDIDQYSLSQLGQFPWPRSTYVPFLQTVSSAKVVAFDIMFNTYSDNVAEDKALVEELAKHDNVVMASSLNLENFFDLETTQKSGEMLYAQDYDNKPIPEIEAVTKLAHINRVVDNDDSIRRTWLRIDSPEGVVPSLAYQVAEMSGANAKQIANKVNNGIKSEIYIKYNNTSRDFFTISFADIVEGNIPPETFEDRIVLVGMAAMGDDKGRTPIAKSTYLVYAHANIVDQLLKDQYITPLSKWYELLISMIVLFGTTWLAWRLKPILSLILAFAAGCGLLYLQYELFQAKLYMLGVAYPVLLIMLSYVCNIAIKTYYETKQKNFITKQFGRYISPELVKEIARSDQEIKLGGSNKELSILFLDVRGFTTLSEQLKPEEVVDFLNMMFDMITEKALNNHGTIDKFIGDAAMILFNAPLDVADHEYHAVKTAYEIQEGMKKVRENIFEKYQVTISCGIGINTGDVVVGNIGSYLRVDYTAIGDNVNTAARIESNTVANQVLVSETTYERTKDYFEYNCIGERMMKGKTVAVKLYEVLSFKQSPDQVKEPA